MMKVAPLAIATLAPNRRWKAMSNSFPSFRFACPSIPGLVALLITLAGADGAQGADGRPSPLRKPAITDTVRANIYADNTFSLYVNGELVAVDSIAFIPHNVISVDILPAYPMTIAVMAKDNADPKTGMEYANTNIGDAGFILKFGDGTVTNGSWKAKCFSHGPVNGDTRNPRVENVPIPENWFAADFDDGSWGRAREYSEADVDPKQPYFDADFTGAKFIWTDDLRLDNTVIFRKTVTAAPDGKQRPDFRGLNDVVPEGPPKGGGRRPQPRRRPPPESRPSPGPPR